MRTRRSKARRRARLLAHTRHSSGRKRRPAEFKSRKGDFGDKSEKGKKAVIDRSEIASKAAEGKQKRTAKNRPAQ